MTAYKPIEQQHGYVSELILECECGADMVVIKENIEEYDTADAGLFYRQSFDMGFFSYGQYKTKPSFLDRLKWCWRYLRTGKIHTDQAILNSADAKQFRKYLGERLDIFDSTHQPIDLKVDKSTES